MEMLVRDLMEGLNVSEEKAKEIISTIGHYVGEQHPLLGDLAREISGKEIEDTRTT